MEDLTTRLRFNGRYASETDTQAAIRRIEEREEAAKEIERLRATVQTRCGHYGRKHHTGGWSCPDCGATGLPTL